MKIFAIGFNKTGTTSFNSLFRSLGINSTHTTTPVMNIIHNYDAFTDGSHYDFKKYYDAYPDSLFILNTRPINKWLISRYKHAHTRNFNKDCWCWPISDEKTNSWIMARENHYKNILDFFIDKPEKLLIVNIEKEGWEMIVTKFIQKPVDKINVTHKNGKNDESINTNIMNMIQKNVYNCLTKNGYNNSNEILAKNIDINLYEYQSYL
jgi:hypothetical protein